MLFVNLVTLSPLRRETVLKKNRQHKAITEEIRLYILYSNPVIYSKSLIIRPWWICNQIKYSFWRGQNLMSLEKLWSANLITYCTWTTNLCYALPTNRCTMHTNTIFVLAHVNAPLFFTSSCMASLPHLLLCKFIKENFSFYWLIFLA